ncbi:MAG: AMP-binding protein [Nostoc sp. DedQUE12b]|uniref:AMP-binding protein n=1 Tax=Nostoc sp. DedQUE12b TaxID=3075398 RepID=UPI002AD22952|nr:AMP-binding protein [Nostoc sp. DedQUE12b]MDZ8086370.1 AMP-binding protein [Nostoc sp. DedQUE12b]
MIKSQGFNNLAEVLTYWTEVQPDRRAYTMLDSHGAENSYITYKDMYSQAIDIAQGLLSQGLRSQNAILLYPPGIEFIVAFFGCLYAGVLPAPIHIPKHNRSNKKIADIVVATKASAILLPASHQQAFYDVLSKEENWPKDLIYVPTDMTKEALNSQKLPLPEIDGSVIAFLQFTSGSTSLPKGVMISHKNCLNNLEMIVAMSHADADSTSVSWLPHYHDLGLVAHLLHSLYSGGHCVLLAPATFASQPIQWLRAISKYRAAYTGAPNFAYQLCVDKIQPSDQKTLDLSSLRMAINAAEPINPETIRDFCEKFAENGFKPHMFLPAYGMAEATVYISSGYVDQDPVFKAVDWTALGQYNIAQEATDSSKEKVFVGCGHPWLDQRIYIVDPDKNCVLSPNHVGEIWTTGSNVMAGYYNNPEATDKTLVSLPDDSRTYLRTGDLGFIDEKGELYITGRIKDIIIVNGVNYYPQDIEICVQQAHPDIRFSCVAAFSVPGEAGEELVIFAELTKTGVINLRRASYLEELAEAICLALGDNFEMPLRQLVFLGHMQIPKTSSGKIRRQQCKQEFLQNNLDALAKWPKEESRTQSKGDVSMLNIEKTFERITSMGPMHLKVFTSLIQILTKRYQVRMADFDVEKSIFFYGIDSLKIIEIHSTLEGELGCQIPTEAFFYANTFLGMIDDIVRAISGEGGSKVRLTHSQPLNIEIENALEYLLRRRDNEVSVSQSRQTNTCLLTGASGFVGTYFLKELLDTTNLNIACLVRAANEEAGLQRIKKTARKFDVHFLPGWENRVQIIIGDMSKKRFGLENDRYEELAQNIDSVYHVAAVDNFYLPYDIIKNTNVIGTIEVADFALAGKVKSLYNVSSCAASLLEDCANQPIPIGLVNGYAQTKYVTEQIVLRLAEQGYPWVNYRLGYLYTLRVKHIEQNTPLNKLFALIEKAYENIDDDFFIDEDAFENFLCAISHIGCIPDMDADFDLMSVEYAAKTIVSTSLLSINERKHNYTFYNPEPLNWSDVISYFQKLNKDVEIVPLRTFVDKYEEYVRNTDKKGMKLLKSVVSPELEKQFNTMFRNINTDQVDTYLHWCPPCEKQFTHQYVDFVLSSAE